ncbi:MAG: hypothetical protein GC178_12210 [Flavobacteriales bacterium]|nr:hypothetical protein [Flavobacteriales bacterium]
MKKLVFTVIALGLASVGFSQNVGIGATSFTPNDDALLELRSTTSGFLLPKMTQAQMNAIVGPTEGLIVYQTNGTKGFKYYNGSAWTEFGGAADNFGDHIATANIQLNDHWLTNDGGSEGIRILDNGNVGIGTSTPDRLLNVGAASGAEVLLTREDASTQNGDLLGQIIFDSTDDTSPSTNGGSAVIRGTASENQGNSNKGGNLSFLTKPNGTLYSSAAIERMTITHDGKVGIGTTSPSKALDVVTSASGLNVISVRNTTTSGWSSIDFLNNSGSLGATFGFANSGTTGIFTNRAYMNSYNHDFVLTRNSSENSIFISGSSGNIGIGTNSPSAKLHVNGGARISNLAGSGTRMVVADANGDISTQALPSSGSSPTTVESSSSQNINSSSYTSVSGMSISSVSAGTYLVNFNADIDRNGSSSCKCIVRAGNSDDSDTERTFQLSSSGTSQYQLMGKVTLSSSGTIEVRCKKIPGGSGITVGNRAMSIQATN